MDIRYEKLADTLVYHSTKLNAGEKSSSSCQWIFHRDMTLALIRAVRECKAIPFVQFKMVELTGMHTWRRACSI